MRLETNRRTLPVVEAIGSEAKSRFTGRIPRLTVEVRDASAKAGGGAR